MRTGLLTLSRRTSASLLIQETPIPSS